MNIIEGYWSKTDIRRAFVEGCKFWEFKKTRFTMWQSDVTECEIEAEKRYCEILDLNGKWKQIKRG